MSARRRLNRIGTGVVISILASGLVVAAVRSQGFKSSEVTLHDNGVWATKDSIIGRYNWDLAQVDAKSPTIGSIATLAQVDATVIVTTAAPKRNLISFDVALDKAKGSVPFPDHGLVAIGGQNGALLDPDTSTVWFTDRDTVGSIKFDETTGGVELDGATDVVVGTDGVAHVLAAGSRSLWTLTEIIGIGGDSPATDASAPLDTTGASDPAAAGGSDSGAPTAPAVPDPLVLAEDTSAVQMTAAGRRAVLLDAEQRRLILDDDTVVPLPDSVGEHPVLQQPADDSFNVLIASDTSLVLVPLDGTDPVVIHTPTEPLGGEPVAPVWLKDCAFGAWALETVQVCGTDVDEHPLASSESGAVFRTNRGHVILNYPSGDLFVFDTDGIKPVTSWSSAFDPSAKQDDATDQTTKGEEDNKCVFDPAKPNTPPVAVADSFNIRANQSAILDVLGGAGSGGQGDSDEDCDVLTVSVPELEQGSLPNGQGRVDVIQSGRALQFTPGTDAQPVTFNYTVSDGTELVVSTVTVNQLAQDAVNDKPVARDDRTTVESGKAVIFNLLGNDYDPNGDSIVVTTAAIRDRTGDTLVWQPNGRISYQSPGGFAGSRFIDYQIADALGDVSSATLEVSVIPVGNQAPNAVSDAVRGLAGQLISINVVDNDSDPNQDTVRLDSIAGYHGTEPQVTSDAGGLVTLIADAGSYNYVYTIIDPSGERASARLRVEVLGADGQHAPVAVKDDAVLSPLQPTVVDALGNDTDIDGDVLAITGVEPLDGADAVASVEILDHRLLRLSLRTDSLENPSVQFRYTVSDGLNVGTGTVNVRLVAGGGGQAPVTVEDLARVHLGGVLSIPVLRNDFDPDGDPLTITSVVMDDKVGLDGPPGEIFVQGDQIRYLPPSPTARPIAFTATATYTVTDGRDVTNGRITIAVTDPTTNSPPNRTVLAMRVVVGHETILSMPTSGLDPDGDAITLGTQTVQARLGTVATDGTSFSYTPFEGSTSAGQDVFEYSIFDPTDPTHQPGYITVKVNITTPAGNSAPVAVNDTAQVKPNSTANLIPILFNDTDADDGDTITLDPTKPFEQPQPGGGVVALSETDGYIAFDAPPVIGQYSFFYFITDGQHSPVRGRVTVTVADDVLNLAPIAQDMLLPPAKPGDVVTVDPLAEADPKARDPEGEQLNVSPTATAEAAGVTTDLTDPTHPVLTVTMGTAPLIFTYVVVDPAGAQAQAIVQIPLVANRAPELQPLTVEIGPEETLKTVDLTATIASADPDGDPVVIYPDAKPEVTSGAEGSTAAELTWTGPATFDFPRNPDFSGTVSIQYRAHDVPPEGLTPFNVIGQVILVIKPKDNKPPEVSTSTVTVESGTTTPAYDLSKIVHDPDIGDVLTYSSVSSSLGSALTVSANGNIVSMTAPDDAVATGKVLDGTISFVVDDGKPNGQVTGTVNVHIIPTNKPAPQAVGDQMDAVKQGSTVEMNVVANDTVAEGAGPLTVVRVGSATGGTVEITSTTNVRFTPTPGFFGLTRFTYTVQDKFADVGRESTATVEVAVKDRPAQPGPPSVGEQLSTTAIVTFNRPEDHGAPIDSFEIAGTPGGSMTCAASPCSVGGLTNGVEYRFKLRAHNEVDWSDWSEFSPPYTPDEVPGTPPTPQADWDDSSATITWGAIPNAGSEILDTTITVSPPDVAAIQFPGGQGGGTKTITGLRNGVSYTFTLTARNNKGLSPVGPRTTPVVPVGAPLALSKPNIVPGNGIVTVSWVAPNGNGDNAMSYTIELVNVTSGGVETTVNAGSALSVQIPATNGVTYQAQFLASNKFTTRKGTRGTLSPPSDSVIPKGPPLVPGTPSATAGPGNGAVNLSWTAADRNGGTITDYQVSINNGTWFSVGNTLSTTVSGNGMALGNSYVFAVRAVNELGPGANSANSNGAIPYTPPAQPTVGCRADPTTTIRCDWSINALNGPGSPAVSVSGSTTNPNSPYFSGEIGNGQGRGVTVQVCNGGTSGNNCSSNGASATTVNARVWVTKGATYPQANGSCAANACNYMIVHVSGFPVNQTFGITCFPGDQYERGGGNIGTDGNGNGGVQVVCIAGTPSDANVSVNGVFGDGSGTW